MKAVVAAFNQEKALVGAFSVITNLRMELFEALLLTAGSIITLPALSPRVPRLRCFVNGSFVSIIHFYVTGSNLLACDVLIICVHIQSWSKEVRYKRKSG